jgi:hypothetical protein
MANRANYLIADGRGLSVFYGHWGAPTVPREVQQGPTACQRFIRTQQGVPEAELLEFAFMEGGIALDTAHRRALFFGGLASVNYDAAIQARLLERIRPAWEAERWTIDWARRYAYDLVGHVGLPGDRVENDVLMGEPADWDEVRHARGWTATLLGRKKGPSWQLFASGCAAARMVHHGARLAREIESLPVLGELEVEEARNLTALLFEEEHKAVTLVCPLFGIAQAPHGLAARARAALPDWDVRLDLDLPLPLTRLETWGIRIRVSGGADARPAPSRTEQDIDELVDAALAYAPEPQIQALEQSVASALEALVSQATARGERIEVISAGPRPKSS